MKKQLFLCLFGLASALVVDISLAMSCKDLGNNQIVDLKDVRSSSAESSLDIGGKRITVFNNADGVIKLLQAGPELTKAEAREIAELLDYANDSLVDASFLLTRPEMVYLFASRTGIDAYWAKPGSWQLKTIYQYLMVLERSGRGLAAVEENIKRQTQQIQIEAAKLFPYDIEAFNEYVAKESMKILEIYQTKNPSFAKAITIHEYVHVLFDHFLAGRFKRLKTVDDINILMANMRKKDDAVKAIGKELLEEMDYLTVTKILHYARGGNKKIFKGSESEYLATLSKKYAKEIVQLVKEAFSFREVFSNTDARIADLGFQVMFGEKFQEKNIPKWRAEKRHLEADLSLVELKIDVFLNRLYAGLTSQQLKFFNSYKAFKEEVLLLVGYGLGQVRDYPELEGKVLNELIANQEILLNFNSLKAEVESLEIKINRPQDEMLEAAQFAPRLAHQMMSKFHELTADIGTVLLSKNNGQAIYNGLYHTAPNRFTDQDMLKSFNDRDFTNKDNRLDRWVPSTVGHNYFAPVRYHLWENYLKQPMYLSFAGRGLAMDNYLRAVSRMLEPLNTFKDFSNLNALRDAGLIEGMTAFATQMTRSSFEKEMKKDPLFRRLMSYARLQEFKEGHLEGEHGESGSALKVKANNEKLIRYIDQEFLENPVRPGM